MRESAVSYGNGAVNCDTATQKKYLLLLTAFLAPKREAITDQPVKSGLTDILKLTLGVSVAFCVIDGVNHVQGESNSHYQQPRHLERENADEAEKRPHCRNQV